VALNDILLRLRLQGQQGVSAGLQQTSRVGVASFAAIIAAGVGVTKALFEIGQAFDDAFDTVRIATGATGAEFAGLQDDVRAIAKVVPSNLADIGTAVAGLNSRLELTGPELRSLAGDFLNLSRLTKTDVAENVRTVTRAFGDWDVAQSAQSRTLNEFLRASQASGAGVSDLAEQVVQFGAPLRQFGFTIEQAIAMFAMFEEAGVNTQTMMPGLKFALKAFYTAGKDPARELAATFKGIRDGSISTKKAMSIFGQRAGADMVEGIRQGRFELDDLTASLSHGDTIQQATKDTSDFAEAWQLFKNQAMLKLEPIAARVFRLLGDGMEALPPYITPVANGLADVYHWLKRHDDLLIAAGAGLAVFVGGMKAYAAWTAVASFVTGGWVVTMGALAAAMWANPVGMVVAAIALLAAGFVYAWRNSATFRDVIYTVGDALKVALLWALNAVIDALTFLMGAYSTMLSLLSHVPGMGWAKDIADQIDGARDAMQRFGETVSGDKSKPKTRFDGVTLHRKGKRPLRSDSGDILAGLARGGTVVHAGAFTTGERGPEVVELPRGAAVHDARTSSPGGGDLAGLVAAVHRLASRPISVQVDGREIARANALQLANDKAFA
jgi:phage-related minor tail protein